VSAPGPAGLPLSGRRILVTRSADQAGALSDLLRAAGAEAVEISLIRFEPPDSWEPADRAIEALEEFSLILFTSANAVDCFLRRIEDRGTDPRRLARRELTAVGPKTAESLAQRGFKVNRLPERFQAEGLLEAMRGKTMRGARILIPRAQEAREILVEELERRGASVTVAPVYRTRAAGENRPALRSALEKGVDMVTFTASSTVLHFFDLAGPDRLAVPGSFRVACIGPVTAECARSRGLVPDVVPLRSTIPDLVGAIIRFYSTDSA
jgi:uroporphyrinogen III methyltransferase / synthase